MADTACPDCGSPTVSRSARFPKCCADCMKVRRRESHRAWMERNPGVQAARVQAFKDAHREAIRAAGRIVVQRAFVCQDCSRDFVRGGNRGPLPKFCPECTAVRKIAATNVYRLNNPEKVLSRARRNNARRRAVTRDIAAEQVQRTVVFERDEWVCQLCHMPVFRTAFRWPAPWSPSLDHILPLSRGGEHTYANTQLAHLRCNLRKNNRVEAVA